MNPAHRWPRRDGGPILVGVVGFSGSWTLNPRRRARREARAVLGHLFREVGERGEAWCVSGATNYGIPALAYEVAGELGLRRIGVTAREALEHELAVLDELWLVGECFGDESGVFVRTCHELWMLGGGAQSEAEVRMAADRGKPVVVVQGLGGRADALGPSDLPGACFLTVEAILDGARPPRRYVCGSQS